ncbi:MAG: DNA-3-methyladenine glycosylase [Chitinophagaceae bacterium]
MNKIPPDFYLQKNVVDLAKQLLGKKIVSNIDNKICSGMIVETEAYKAPEDHASHAYNGRRNAKNETMYAQGGVVYVYTIYGVYPLLNIVTNVEEIPHAILIRAIEPIDGLDIMLQRRGLTQFSPRVVAGPGMLAQALGVKQIHNATSLQSNTLWLETHQTISKTKIVATPRIGLGKVSEPYYGMPWRFCVKDNLYLSKKIDYSSAKS